MNLYVNKDGHDTFVGDFETFSDVQSYIDNDGDHVLEQDYVLETKPGEFLVYCDQESPWLAVVKAEDGSWLETE